MKHVAVAALAALFTAGVSFAPASGATDAYGHWSLAPIVPAEPGRVQLHIEVENLRQSWTNSVPLADAGISGERLNGPVGPVAFEIRRDAGTFACTGNAGAGAGSGELTYVPNAAFDEALALRGFGRPTASQSVALAVGGMTLAFLDRLRPSMPSASVADVVRLVNHGATPRYLAAYDALGYHLDSAAQLQRLIDHGATPGFIDAFRRAGYRDLSPDQAVRLVDAGASAAFVQRLRARGYTNLSVDQVISLRNSGRPL
ncbi:MAG TPA: hypothetical protein VGU66_14965 [Candidatus Elarobacter sp.]|nr:hypothetical protein [Candidatus Elarobacter sp.]